MDIHVTGARDILAGTGAPQCGELSADGERDSVADTPLAARVGGGGGTFGGGDIVEVKQPLVDGDVEEVGDLSLESIEMKKWASWMEFLRSMNNCFGGIMLILGLLEGLEVKALVDVMEVMVVDDE
ncbi:hypothetical protein Tco_0796314 [Tanacetum coccineum]